jgi:putative transposase
VKYAYPVKKMCRWLEVSPSGFFDWKRRPQSPTTARRADLTTHIVKIFDDSDETYGYRRVHAELRGRGRPGRAGARPRHHARPAARALPAPTLAGQPHR